MSESTIPSQHPGTDAPRRLLAETIEKSVPRGVIVQALLDRHIARGGESGVPVLRAGVRPEDLPVALRRQFEADADAVVAAIMLSLIRPASTSAPVPASGAPHLREVPRDVPDLAGNSGAHEGALDIPKSAGHRDERAEKRAMGFSGEICSVCDSAEVARVGACLTCRNCGTTSSLHLREIAGGLLQVESTSFHDGALAIRKSPTPRDDRAEKRAMGFSGEVCSICNSAEMAKEGTHLICRNCGTTRQASP